MKKVYTLIGLLIIIVLVIWAVKYLALFQAKPENGTIAGTETQATSNNQASSDKLTSNDSTTVPYKLETVATDLYVPWSLVFTSETRLLVSERNGAIRIIENDKLIKEPLAQFSEVISNGEEGLMGLALDPDYATNNLIYACLAYRSDNGLRDKVVRFEDKGDSIASITTILDSIPSAANHAGCRLLFMPDKTLLISTGDASNKNNAQDLTSLGGKILRINGNGSIPQDNPFAGSPVWSFGHRNPQGLALDAEHSILWSSEHGPSVIDGPAGGDEINIIEKGANYGWPIIHHKEQKEGLISPLLEFTPAVAPGSILFYNSTTFPQFTNSLFFGALKGEGIFQLSLDPQNPKRITAFTKLPDITVGRIRDIIQAPDGSIYFTTSNRDGRGKQRDNDDTVYRLVPRQ